MIGDAPLQTHWCAQKACQSNSSQEFRGRRTLRGAQDLNLDMRTGLRADWSTIRKETI